MRVALEIDRKMFDKRFLYLLIGLKRFEGHLLRNLPFKLQICSSLSNNRKFMIYYHKEGRTAMKRFWFSRNGGFKKKKLKVQFNESTKWVPKFKNFTR